MKPTVTLIVLSKNQAESIRRTLAVARRYVDQIVIWDDHSVDHIQDVANELKAQYHKHQLQGDFAAHRNAALQLVQTDWTVFLDGDEFASDQWWQECAQEMQREKVDALRTPRRDWFLGRWLRHGETPHVLLTRVARTSLGKNAWSRAVHEVWNIPSKRFATLRTPLDHTSHPSLSAFLEKLHAYAAQEKLEAPKKISFIKLLLTTLTFPIAKWLKAVIWQQGWRDGIPGLIHATCMAYYSLIKRIFLYEHSQKTLPHSR